MSDWIPVSPIRKCVICGKPSWCMASPDGKAHLCNRVQSDRPAKGGGWLHGTPERASGPVARQDRKPAYDPPEFDAPLWWQTARHAAQISKLSAWACSLGLLPSSIDFLGAVTVGGMLCFPMFDGNGNICGIRTRNHAGQKRAITGSKAGVFLATIQAEEDVLICEGPTDAAAALALGFEPIGRPSCIGQEMHVVDTLKRWGKQRATICADADGPGIAGADRLAKTLRACRIKVRMVAPVGHKDLRDWYRSGVRRNDVEIAWSQAAWN